jgi:hypothetical protein
MKGTFLKRFVATVLALAAIVGAIQIYVFAQEENEKAARRSLEGVWQTTVTPRNCQTGEQTMPAFQGLLTFHQDGTLAEISTVTNPALRTAGHGVWRRERGWSEYSMAFMFYRFNPAGALVGSQKVRQNIRLGETGDEFTSTGTVEILDLNGNTIGTGCTTSTATRFE